MSPVKTVYVPLFSSRQGSSQRDDPQPDQLMDQTEPRSQCPREKRGNKRGVRGQKTRCVLKVKLPKLSSSTPLSQKTREDKPPRKWMLGLLPNKSKTTVNRGETQRAGPDTHSVGGGVSFFSQRPTSKATNEKGKAKLSVLRTISRMLEENQLIRQRLAALSQAN